MFTPGTIRFGKLIDHTLYVQSLANQKQIYTWQTSEEHGASVMGQFRPGKENAFVANFYKSDDGRDLAWTRVQLEQNSANPGQTDVYLSSPAVRTGAKHYVVDPNGTMTPELQPDADGQVKEMIQDAITLRMRFRDAIRNEKPFKNANDNFPLMTYPTGVMGRKKQFFALGKPLFPGQDNLLIQGEIGPDGYSTPNAVFTAQFHGRVADFPELTKVGLKKEKGADDLDAKLSMFAIGQEETCKVKDGKLTSNPLTDIRNRLLMAAVALRAQLIAAGNNKTK